MVVGRLLAVVVVVGKLLVVGVVVGRLLEVVVGRLTDTRAGGLLLVHYWLWWLMIHGGRLVLVDRLLVDYLGLRMRLIDCRLRYDLCFFVRRL